MSVELVEEAIYEHLTSSGEVQTILDERVYPMVLPQRVTYPAMMFFIRQVEDFPTLGSSGDRPDKSTFRFFSTDADYIGAKRLAKALKKRINGYQGTIGGVEIQGIERVRESDLYDPDTKTYQVVSDYEVMAVYG